MSDGWSELEQFLATDPRDIGCDGALRLLHVYVDLVLGDGTEEAALRYPEVAAHLVACGPCSEDFEGLILAAGAGGTAGADRDSP